MNLQLYLEQNPFFLAPMAAITDNAFRSFMREMGAGILTTELVSANAICYKNERTFRIMRYEDMQRPVGIQLFGETPEAIAEGAKLAEDLGVDFIDLNFGCPVSKVVKKGAGSAVLKDLQQLRAILRAVRSAISIPLTMKIRTGWTRAQRNAIEVAQVAYDEGVLWLAIHGRDRAQAYTGKADWDYIAKVKAAAKLPVIGNGDIHSGHRANERLQESGVDAVMIGRGALKNPWIFQDALAVRNGLEVAYQDRDYMQVFLRLRYHYERLVEDEKILNLQLRKFASWFSHGYPGSAQFRKHLFRGESVDHTVEMVHEFYQSIRGQIQADTSEEAFLMGGHG